MEIYIIRHGKTDWNNVKRLQGRTDIELNDEGIELAKKTAKGLKDVKFDVIYSSPLKRAVKTAEIIAFGNDVPIIIDDRLMEISFGEYEGKHSPKLRENPNEAFYHFFDRPEKYLPETGENFLEVIERTKSFVKELEEKKDELKRIMIVGHGAVNKGLMCHMSNRNVVDYWSGGLQKNCSVTIYNLTDDGFELIEENKIYG